MIEIPWFQLEIDDIVDIDNIMYIQFGIWSVWKDSRVTFINLNKDKETFISERTNQHKEITIQAETQSLSQVSEVSMSEERQEDRAADVHKTINLEDKCEDRKEMSENPSTTSSLPQLDDKNKELCQRQELDQCKTDGTEDKDKSTGSKVECEEPGVDKEETPEDISAEENDKRSSESAENEKKQNITEGEKEKI